VPANPGGWLSLAARRRAIDLLRKRSRELPLADEWDADATAADAVERTGDERLPMLFGCCHPALSVEARLALTLRAVVGMTTAQIARAFLVPEATMAAAGTCQAQDHQRWHSVHDPRNGWSCSASGRVLTVIYLSYNAGYLEPSESGRELSDDAIWLAELVARALPDQAELGDHEGARAANQRALALTHNPAEQQLLRSRLAALDLEVAAQL
jgi:predicted RNA polymerase sigma factor